MGRFGGWGVFLGRPGGLGSNFFPQGSPAPPAFSGPGPTRLSPPKPFVTGENFEPGGVGEAANFRGRGPIKEGLIGFRRRGGDKKKKTHTGWFALFPPRAPAGGMEDRKAKNGKKNLDLAPAAGRGGVGPGGILLGDKFQRNERGTITRGVKKTHAPVIGGGPGKPWANLKKGRNRILLGGAQGAGPGGWAGGRSAGRGLGHRRQTKFGSDSIDLLGTTRIL